MNARPQTTSPPITIWVCKSAGPIPPSTANCAHQQRLRDASQRLNRSSRTREQGIDYGLDL